MRAFVYLQLLLKFNNDNPLDNPIKSSYKKSLLRFLSGKLYQNSYNEYRARQIVQDNENIPYKLRDVSKNIRQLPSDHLIIRGLC